MAILNWNGIDVPDELRQLPAGRYVISSAEEAPTLTQEQEAGLDEAVRSLSRGEGLPHEQVLDRVGKLIHR